LSPIVTAFAIWSVHFLVCWAASEIWPRQWPANALAWGATAIALLAVGVHYVRVNAQHARGGLSGWEHRFARGATAIAAVAVLFSALPSIVFLP
jgi:uncharacterized membrane protein YidH (DUF202 family)